MNTLSSDLSYRNFLAEVKQKIQHAQVKAMITVNQQLIYLYWDIGNRILTLQQEQGWGKGVIGQLSSDLKKAFPDMKGFSSRNLSYMKRFASLYPDTQILQEALAKISWYHNVTLFHKCSTNQERIWYAQKAIEHGWSRNIMVYHIESNLYGREGKALTNFSIALPSPQSDMAQQTLKDPYLFDFIALSKDAKEKELEQQLVKHITKFLLELGAGFAFVGNQYLVKADEEDFAIDLLFYHLKLRCYIAIDLKIGNFKPEYVGKMNFYLSALDDQVKAEEDNPSIGVILCKGKKKVMAEYALRDISKPIGIAEYRITEAIPKELKSNLPSIEDFERELRDIEIEADEKG